MATSAIYSLTTGIIQSSVSPPLTDQAQISALAAEGMGHMIVPDGTTGANAIIDLSNNSVTAVAAQIPIPNILVQYVAAQINAGNLDPSVFHPVTIASMNAALAAVNMTTVAAVASTASTAAGAAPTS